MELYSVKKSDGRGGYQWTCPKGFTHYNFWTEESTWQDAKAHYASRADKETLK